MTYLFGKDSLATTRDYLESLILNLFLKDE